MADDELPNNPTGENSDDDDESEFEEQPTLFVMSGVDTSLDEIVLEDCLTKVLSSYDIGNDESGDDDEDRENFLPSILVTLLETDYNDEPGTILFCVDRSLVVIGDEDEDGTEEASPSPSNEEEVLRKIREYAGSDEASASDPVWIKDASKVTIEVVVEDEIQQLTEAEAYESWLKHNQAEGGDNSLVEPEYHPDEKKEAEE